MIDISFGLVIGGIFLVIIVLAIISDHVDLRSDYAEGTRIDEPTPLPKAD